MREKVIERILEKKIIAIVRGAEEKVMLPLAEALLAGGIGLMEVTFNQAKPETFVVTARSIAALRRAFGGKLYCGAGTVLRQEQVELACEAGALFIVSPNTDEDVIRRTRERGLVSLPGAMTPGECVLADRAGADFIKLFPAGNLGPEYLAAIRAPLSRMKFLAVGGINERNMAEFLKAGAAGFGIGGSLVNKDWIAAGEFDKITALARQMVQIVSG